MMQRHRHLLSGMSRRGMLAGMAAGAALAKASGAIAQSVPSPARVKGPRVWIDMDQRELDDAYDQNKYAANLAQIVRRYATNSEAVRQRLGAPRALGLWIDTDRGR